MDKIYLQMYSFGEFNPALTKDQLKEAAEMGYCGVELFGPNLMMPAQEMKETLAANNLEAISLHAGSDDILKMLPYAKEVGLTCIGIGMEYLPDHEATVKFAEKLNELGKACHEEGLILTYHNHTQEFNEFDGEIVLETLIQRTNPEYVGFELDCGWCMAAGTDPVAFIHKHAGRIKLIHIKECNKVMGPEAPMNPADMKFDEKGIPVMSDEQKLLMQEKMAMDCCKGEGLVDWKAVKTAADSQGCLAYIVERESSYKESRIDCLKEDIAYLKENV